MTETKDIHSENPWIVARTTARNEFSLKQYFEKINIPCFLPTRKEMYKAKSGDMEEREVPLISNLIFFQADLKMANQLFNLNSSRLFRVRNREGLLMVSPREMNRFIAFVTEHYNSLIVVDALEFQLGDRMMIKSGPLAGLEGKVIKIDNRNYFTVGFQGILAVGVRFPKANLIKVREKGGKTDK